MVSPVKVYMTEEEAMFIEWDECSSQHGSSLEDTIPKLMSIDRVRSSTSAWPSRVVLSTEDVKTKDLGLVKSRGQGQLVEHDHRVILAREY